MAQWWRIHLLRYGTWIQSLVQEDPTYLETTTSTRHNYWARTPRARAQQQEMPQQGEACARQLESSPCSPQLKEAQQPRPSAAKNK